MLERLTARDAAFVHVFLRAAFFVQNLSTVHAADLRERSELFLPAGHGRTAFVDARDVGVMIALYTTARVGLAAHLSPELTSLLGRPPITFEEFARSAADAWR